MEKNLSDLLNLIITEEDRRIIESLLSDLSQNIYKTDSTFEDILSSNSSYADAIVKLLPADFHQMTDKRPLEEAIMDLKAKISKIKSVSLTLAIYPTAKILRDLSQFAQKNLQSSLSPTLEEKIIFDIQINPDILGGVILVKDGKYFDYSLLKKLNAVFETKKDELIAMVK